MKRTLTILVALALLTPAAFAEDEHPVLNQPGPSANPTGGMVGMGMMMPMSPMTVSTPVNPNPAMMDPSTQNHMPLAQLVDLGLSDKQIMKLIDIKSDLQEKQLPLVRQLVDKQEDLAVLNQADTPDRDAIKDAKIALINVQTDLSKVYDDANAKAMKVLNDDQKKALGDRPLPFFSGGMHGMYGPMMYHHQMMGPKGWKKGSSKSDGGN